MPLHFTLRGVISCVCDGVGPCSFSEHPTNVAGLRVALVLMTPTVQRRVVVTVRKV